MQASRKAVMPATYQMPLINLPVFHQTCSMSHTAALPVRNNVYINSKLNFAKSSDLRVPDNPGGQGKSSRDRSDT